MNIPDKTSPLPLANYDRLCFLQNTVKNPNIIVGDYTYYDDFEDPSNFEKNVKYHFDFIGDKLIIGKFCMIASGVIFVMNGAIINGRDYGVPFQYIWRRLSPGNS